MRTPLCLQLASTHVSWLTLTECDRNSHAQREAFIIRVDSLRIRDCEYLMPVVFAEQAADSALTVTRCYSGINWQSLGKPHHLSVIAKHRKKPLNIRLKSIVFQRVPRPCRSTC